MRCSCTEANLLRVTNVPVSFLQRRSALSNLSGSSFRNFSLQIALSISADIRPFKPSCNIGNFAFRSATVLLDLDKINAIFSTSDILTRSRLLMTLFRSSSTFSSRSQRSLSSLVISCLYEASSRCILTLSASADPCSKHVSLDCSSVVIFVTVSRRISFMVSALACDVLRRFLTSVLSSFAFFCRTRS